jgi:hypothetical protein
MLGQVFLIVAMLFLLVAQSPVLVLVYSAWRGASSGLWMVAADVAWPSYFGRKHLGSIRGIGYGVGVVGAAIFKGRGSADAVQRSTVVPAGSLPVLMASFMHRDDYSIHVGTTS